MNKKQTNKQHQTNKQTNPQKITNYCIQPTSKYLDLKILLSGTISDTMPIYAIPKIISVTMPCTLGIGRQCNLSTYMFPALTNHGTSLKYKCLIRLYSSSWHQ